ncbi:hypothetical protein Tco_0388962 [Tanacetum coccineum]
MGTEVDQCSVDKKYFEIEKKEILIENDRLLKQIISQDIVCTTMHSSDDLVKYDDMENSFIDEYNKCLELEAELFKKKDMVEKIEQVHILNVIASRIIKLDLQPLSPKLKINREAHVDYLKQTKEHDDTLRELVEHATTLKPLDNALDYACKFTTRIQELLVYVSVTCPSFPNESEKLVAVTQMNKKGF